MMWIAEHTGGLCPACGYEIDDDDGVNFKEAVGEVICLYCNTKFEYAKNFKMSPFNPCTNIEWVSTIMISIDEKVNSK